MFDFKITRVSRLDSIRTRLSVVFILIVLLPMVIISAMLGISGSEGARAQLAIELDLAASYKELALRSWVDFLGYEMREWVIGNNPLDQIILLAERQHTAGDRPAVFQDMDARLSTAIKSARHFSSVFLMNDEGKVIASSDHSFVGRVFKDQIFFTNGVIKQGIYILHGERPEIIISMPVVDQSGRYVVVIAGKVNPAGLEQIMNMRTGLGSTGRQYLITGNGALLLPALGKKSGDIITSSEIARMLSSGTNSTGAYVDYRGVPVIGSCRWMADIGIAIVTEQDQSESANTLAVILAVNASVAVAAVLIAAFASIGVTRSISKPLGELADTAGRLATGEFDLTAKAERNDEIGILAQSFNHMTSQLKMTLEGLRQSEEKYRGIFEKALEGIFQSAPGGGFISANPAMAAMLGFDSPAQLIAEYTDTEHQLYVHPGARKAIMNDLLVHGVLLGREEQWYRRDKTVIWVSMSVTLVKNDDGTPAYVEGLVTDISARKNAEDALRKLNDELEQRVYDRTRQLAMANEELKELAGRLEGAYEELKTAQSRILQQEKMASIGQLAAGVAHEINNPVGFIMSNLNSLSRYADKIAEFVNAQAERIRSEAARDAEHFSALLVDMNERKAAIKLDYLLSDLKDIIRESLDGAERVKRIVQDLKSFARVDEAGMKMSDINAGIESTIAIVWNEIKYKATLEKELGDIPLTMCNPGQLNQVFVNILVNAAQAIQDSGVITVKTWCEHEMIHISISDTGSGIPEDVRNRIFEPFYTTKDVGKGTGLGLSIVYDIVKKHNGNIQIESELGKGTTFVITVPVIGG